jgi:hypothetical protein
MTTPHKSYGDIIFAARQALDSDLPERDIVKLLRKAASFPASPYKKDGEKLTADLPAYHRKRRELFKAQGRCTDCGGKNDRHPCITCTRCYAKRKANY